MTASKCKRTILFFILPLCLTFYSQYSTADDTSFGGSGASPIPIDQPDISMVNEEITIEGQDLSYSEINGTWHYHCFFTFTNHTDKKLAIYMGFPFPVYHEEDNVSTPYGYKVQVGDPLVYNFSVHIDDKAIAVEKKSIKPNEKKGLNYEEAYLWPMTFAPNQTIHIEHDYTTGTTFDVMGFNWVAYVLKTGGLWKNGRIGRAVLKVIPHTPTRLCSELNSSADYLNPSPKGMQIIEHGKDREYYWDLTDLHPTEDLSVCLQTGRNYIRYTVVFGILQYREPVINVHDLDAKQLRLTRNTIYAQYGRKFNSPDLQNYFNQQWWYEPNENYSDSLLTEEDNKALNLIKQAEEKLSLSQ